MSLQISQAHEATYDNLNYPTGIRAQVVESPAFEDDNGTGYYGSIGLTSTRDLPYGKETLAENLVY
jgi:hypothetical protein